MLNLVLFCCTVKQNKIKYNYNNNINRKGNVCITCLSFNVNGDVINVIIVQLNMNTDVFRIHDMNTLYKIFDLKYNGKYFM